ncbi:hypothetical protein [Erwinia persicina]|uniref:HNH endonuclease n=1 Tax=Erwinia persicina TaxID=55211 RepID=A0ABR8ZY75_9GAMM|nr:hypothetical protein [Erwinia persicina]MBD8108675.1 hypothetical protein [Erwinia persicina]MBD8211794.1 hypothetical protein [Erwinia persicina]
MKDKITIDVCALCLKEKELMDSHFFPKFVYRSMNKIKKDKTEKILLKNDRSAAPLFHEIKKFFLCSCCEKKLNINGEDYTARLITPSKNLPPKINIIYSKNLPCNILYHTSQIEDLDNEKIVYFATSMFWRALSDWYGYCALKFPENIISDMRNVLYYKVKPSSYIIISMPLFLFEQYSIIFPKKYQRKDIYNGDFYYFTIFNSCFILMNKEIFMKYYDLNSLKDSLYHMKNDILEIGIMKEFIHNYRKKISNDGMKYSTDVSWILKYIYNNNCNFKGNYKLLFNINAMLTVEGTYRYFYFIANTGSMDYSKTYFKPPNKSTKVNEWSLTKWGVKW